MKNIKWRGEPIEVLVQKLSIHRCFTEFLSYSWPQSGSVMCALKLPRFKLLCFSLMAILCLPFTNAFLFHFFFNFKGQFWLPRGCFCGPGLGRGEVLSLPAHVLSPLLDSAERVCFHSSSGVEVLLVLTGRAALQVLVMGYDLKLTVKPGFI